MVLLNEGKILITNQTSDSFDLCLTHYPDIIEDRARTEPKSLSMLGKPDMTMDIKKLVHFNYKIHFIDSDF